ncbi:MAG: UDP-N-acetylmuramoyl-L-alanine--D-glutamate ligase [Fimbriimonadaceae bacterium]|nr:UDP-N-acetylmuramoyl-L-alanine--D-glutamate ligase [Fimbriimonadaceae bacterium]
MHDAFRGQRVAVAGLGVSGVAVAKAVQAGGGHAIAFDERPAETAAALGTHEILLASGADVVTGWHGRLSEVEYDVLVVSPGFARHHPALRDAKAMGKPILSEIEFAYRISEAPIVGITGTNGKSTTTVLAWTIASTLGNAWLAGNISGSGYDEHTLTDAARMASKDDLIVAEISSFQLEWIEHFAPIAAAITNITPDHLDRYVNFEEYRDTKFRIFESVPAGGKCFIVEEEPSLPEVLVRPHAVVGKLEVVPPASQSEAPWAGAHDLRNLALAKALVQQWRPPNKESATAIREFRGLAHRMERLGERAGVLVINNSMCTNPAAVIASSKSVDRPQVLLLGGVTKGLDFSPVGEYLRASGHRAVLFGPIGQNFRKEVGEWPHVEELGDAFTLAVSLSSAGSALLFAPGCASALPYANFRVRGEAFRQLAKEWLEK